MEPDRPRIDDLTAIKGIGQARQQWLRESLNVFTYGDLAALPVDELETQLRAGGQIASRDEVARWIAEARDRFEAETSKREVKIAGGDSGSEITPSNLATGWNPLATFIIEFQAATLQNQVEKYRTFVHHMEADADQFWPGIESEHLSKWLMDQIGETGLFGSGAKRSIQESSLASEPTAKPSLRPVIEQLRVFQPVESKRPLGIARASKPFSRQVKGNQPFGLEAGLKFEILNGAEINHTQLSYRAQFYAQNILTGSRIHLGNTDSGSIDRDRRAYSARLKQVILARGLYRIQALVILQGALANPGYLEVTQFQVV